MAAFDTLALATAIDSRVGAAGALAPLLLADSMWARSTAALISHARPVLVRPPSQRSKVARNQIKLVLLLLKRPIQMDASTIKVPLLTCAAKLPAAIQSQRVVLSLGWPLS